MSKIIKIKKGLDIPIVGAAASTVTVDKTSRMFAVVPDDFPGYKWKTAVAEGDTVTAGAALLFAKEDNAIKLVSPVGGTVKEVKRGERRKIEYISVEADSDQPAIVKADDGNADAILATLKESGLFAMLRQRPFDTVPFLPQTPRDIFITAFDTAPLAMPMLRDEDMADLENGIKILSKLTDGKVYISVPRGSGISSANAEVYEFEGPHPSGNVSVQIAAIKPINKGESVWTLDATTAVRIGRLFATGTLDFTTFVAVTGAEAANPHIIRTKIGASLKTLLNGEIKSESFNVRVISGNVLTGYKCDPEAGYLRFPYRQVTLIPEGDHADEFMGWASLNPGKYSIKRSFPNFLHGLKKPFGFDARIKGGHRALILSNEYDDVFPFDIYAEYLLKAIIAKDIEKMEQLGIYEVAPEDFALPEFVDSSKIELQKLVRDGLDYLRSETI